jgi:hypothetical protein
MMSHNLQGKRLTSHWIHSANFGRVFAEHERLQVVQCSSVLEPSPLPINMMAVLAPRSSHLRGTYGSVRHPNKKGDRSLRSPSFGMVTAHYPIQSFNCHSFNHGSTWDCGWELPCPQWRPPLDDSGIGLSGGQSVRILTSLENLSPLQPRTSDQLKRATHSIPH